ncbi:MAG: DUF3107 domain-containing protein [Acidimicrobiales bacterium]
MDVRVGVSHTAKEILVELAEDAEQDKLIAEVEAALSTDTGVLWLTDRKGRRVGVPAAKLAYVEIGHPSQDHKVGFAR